jgi:hypothetical protein
MSAAAWRDHLSVAEVAAAVKALISRAEHFEL